MVAVWLGVVQLDPLAVGKFRHYKWKRSNMSIPNTGMVWGNRYVPTVSYPEACGHFIHDLSDSRLYDHSCSSNIWFICEW